MKIKLPHTILIAPDSFKGTLTSLEATEVISQALHHILQEVESIALPIADGGEGTIEILHRFMGGHLTEIETLDPLFRPITASYLQLPCRSAIIELAAASGLTLLKETEYNPMLTTTMGTGLLLKHALEQGNTNITITIGGSATNDAGMGIMNVLGFKFLDEMGNLLSPIGENLLKIDQINCEYIIPDLKSCSFTLLCDVNNTLYGDNGAAKVFATQKGASSEMVEILDQGLKHWSNMVYKTLGIDYSLRSGAGAAGGVGAACMAFLKADSKSGIEYLLEKAHFEKIIETVDLIITGEGCLDNQSFQGKVLNGIYKLSEHTQTPILVFAGKVNITTLPKRVTVSCITPETMPHHIAMQKQQAKKNLYKAVVDYFKTISDVNNNK